MSKYSINDIAKVKSVAQMKNTAILLGGFVDKNYGSIMLGDQEFTSNMQRFCGDYIKITETYANHSRGYDYEGDNGPYFSDWMLE